MGTRPFALGARGLAGIHPCPGCPPPRQRRCPSLTAGLPGAPPAWLRVYSSCIISALAKSAVGLGIHARFSSPLTLRERVWFKLRDLVAKLLNRAGFHLPDLGTKRTLVKVVVGVVCAWTSSPHEECGRNFVGLWHRYCAEFHAF